jgi:hypothetical protein
MLTFVACLEELIGTSGISLLPNQDLATNSEISAPETECDGPATASDQASAATCITDNYGKTCVHSRMRRLAKTEPVV